MNINSNSIYNRNCFIPNWQTFNFDYREEESEEDKFWSFMITIISIRLFPLIVIITTFDKIQCWSSIIYYSMLKNIPNQPDVV